MAELRVQRRLAAIVSSDVVGYSAMMGRDEAGTLARLKTLRAEFLHPKVAEFRGRIVKTTGDGTLIEFGSAVDAVAHAVAVQRGIAERNAALPEDRRITLRLGVNLGDVIIDGEDIFGEGVNVAARLEALAEPGGICVSRAVHDHVRNKVDASFEDLGEREMKNIAEPVGVYRWRPDSQPASPSAGTGASGSADRPSLAVLPFDNLSSDPEQDYFSDGLVEDLITDISKISGLFVVARNSSFAFKGQPLEVKDIARKLGVKHVVEGSVRKMGAKIRINAQLIDAASGGHLWAERYDGDMQNVFEFQDDIRAQIVSALRVRLTSDDRRMAERKSTQNVEAYDLFLKGRAAYYGYTPENWIEARRLLERAIELDPNFAEAHGYLSYVLLSGQSFLVPGFEDVLGRAMELAERGVALDGASAIAHTRLGWVQTWSRRYDQAITSMEKAFALAPDNAEVCAIYAVTLCWLGEPERALQMMDRALRIDTVVPASWEVMVGNAHFLMRHYDAAIDWLRRAVDRAPKFLPGYEVLACAYVEAGRLDESRDTVGKLLEIMPRWTISHATVSRVHKIEADRERCIAALRAAGLPE